MRRNGFTTVELLITLFVAAIFLIAGYALSSLVVNDSGETRAEVRATGLAKEYLDRYSVIIGECAPATPVSGLSETVEGLSNVEVTVTITCPNASVPRVSLVTVTVTYNSPQSSLTLSSYSAGE